MIDKKYFYTDPLVAAYMAREFGVKYGIKYNGKFVWKPIFVNNAWKVMDTLDEILDEYSNDGTDNLFYIHPESLHIFEPQLGDVGLRFCEDPDHYYPVWYKPDAGGWVTDIGDLVGDSEIIYRQHKHFFMPKLQPYTVNKE